VVRLITPAARRLNAGRLLKKGRKRLFKTDGGNETPERVVSTEPGLWFIVFFSIYVEKHLFSLTLCQISY